MLSLARQIVTILIDKMDSMRYICTTSKIKV